MEKFKFDTKLQEAVLKRRDGQQPTIILNGREKKVQCPVFVGTGTRDIPCLIEEDNKVGNAGYTVLAVSFDGLYVENKNWVCIQPMLIEQSIRFFIENHQMESMSEACRCASRLADSRGSGFDLETENAMIEIKVPLIVPNGIDICIWKGFRQAVKQVCGYCISHYAKGNGKRIELLTICQHGTNNILAVNNDNMKKELERAVRMGIELWVAETRTEEDGISLLKYWNYTDKILKS